MAETSDPIREQFLRAYSELKTMRDEIRVRLHLASMEAKTRWQEDLEPRLNELEHQLKQVGEKAEETAKQALNDLSDAVKKFRGSLGGDDSKPGAAA